MLIHNGIERETRRDRKEREHNKLIHNGIEREQMNLPQHPLVHQANP